MQSKQILIRSLLKKYIEDFVVKLTVIITSRVCYSWTEVSMKILDVDETMVTLNNEPIDWIGFSLPFSSGLL